MKREKPVVLSGYEASAEEVQSLIMQWAKATEAFHMRYVKLDKTINTLQKTARRLPKSSPERARLRRLIELRQHITDVLMTLLLDMSGQKASRTAQPSKPGQLRSHASLLNELNRKIDAELIGITQPVPASTYDNYEIIEVDQKGKDENYFEAYVDSTIEAYGINNSDKLSLVSVLYSGYYEEYGQYIFKDFLNYEKWLLQASPDFGGNSPYDYVINTSDLLKVKDILGRLSYGVYF